MPGFRKGAIANRALASFALLMSPAGVTHATDNGFDAGWEFRRTATARDDGTLAPLAEGWRLVALPHTPMIEPRIVNDQWQGMALYRKRFGIDPAWRGQTVLLRFEAAMNVATVSLNGQRLTRHLGGYLPFTVDLTPALRPSGDNVIEVELDNRDNPVTGPKPLKALDFNTYGGLYRGVRLIVKPTVHITDEMLADRVAGGGVFVTYPHVDARRAELAIMTDLANAARKARRVRVVQTLWNGNTKIAEVMTPVTLAAGGHQAVRQTLAVPSPRLWSPRAPNLYRLATRVEDSGAIDHIETRIGIRRLETTRNMFRINGETLRLRGVNRHQEYPYVGYALSPQADARDARLIKAAGFDFVRLSHYPQSPAFMAAADELGLVLLNAIPGWQYHNPDPAFRAQALQTCRDMIRRDRNHASVIAWECSLNETQMPVDLVAAFTRTVHEEYPGDQAWSAGWLPDGYDIFIDARQHRLTKPWTKRDRPYLVSEYGDWEYYAGNAGFNQQAWGELKRDDRSSRQALGGGEARLLQQASNVQEAHDDNFTTPAFADAYWAMFDYNRGYADDLETSGLMNLERVPKFAYQFFRSQRDAGERGDWGGGPMVFVASHWTPQSAAHVRVFSNAEEVELVLNGRSLGRRKPDDDRVSKRLAHPPFTFDTGRFAAGALEARAYIGAREVARHAVRTPGKPARLALALDDAGVAPVAGDVVFARARILDAAGATVPVSGWPVRFAASDGYEIVGAATNATEAGIASILVRIARPGAGRLSASTPGIVENDR